MKAEPSKKNKMPKYKYSKVGTVEDLLEAIGRTDIPSTEVSLTRSGDKTEIDFGKHNLTLADEEKLKVSLKGMGFSESLREG